MAEIGSSIDELMDKIKSKLDEGVLPPDPARIVKQVIEIPVEIEHATPLPPLLETIHHEITVPLIEKLPRLPMTRDFGKE